MLKQRDSRAMDIDMVKDLFGTDDGSRTPPGRPAIELELKLLLEVGLLPGPTDSGAAVFVEPLYNPF